MPGYISEIDYFGESPDEFVEVAVPTGTDVSSYSLVLYDAGGNLIATYSLGELRGTMAGQDVYVLDTATPGFDSGGDATGTFYPDDGIALVDDTGTVLQFVSWEGNTVTAGSGPASGQTSTNIGSQPAGGSLQSDDGGASYFSQPTSNSGSIPTCFAPGTLIRCGADERLVETLRPGAPVTTWRGRPQPLVMVLRKSVEITRPEDAPILIKRGALGAGTPDQDLIVSAQHCVLTGTDGQLTAQGSQPRLCRAKALVGLPGIRQMRGKRRMVWIHLILRDHQILRSNGCWSESCYLGPMTLAGMPQPQRRVLARRLGVLPKQLSQAHKRRLKVLPVSQTPQRLAAGLGSSPSAMVAQSPPALAPLNAL